MPSQPEKSVFLIINQQITPLIKDVISFGRQLDNNVVLQDESISRHHAELRNEAGKYILSDKQSASGTFVNGRRVIRCLLNSGDLISLANIRKRYWSIYCQINRRRAGRQVKGGKCAQTRYHQHHHA
jgi:pSer/pThr/pTyr-binding forkhead associated (FHA) protein